jgi:hypothetical protein
MLRLNRLTNKFQRCQTVPLREEKQKYRKGHWVTLTWSGACLRKITSCFKNLKNKN